MNLNSLRRAARTLNPRTEGKTWKIVAEDGDYLKVILNTDPEGSYYIEKGMYNRPNHNPLSYPLFSDDPSRTGASVRKQHLTALGKIFKNYGSIFPKDAIDQHLGGILSRTLWVISHPTGEYEITERGMTNLRNKGYL